MFGLTYILMVLIPGLVLSGLASLMVRSAFSKYSGVGTRRGLTGAQAAQQLLNNAGIYDVSVVPVAGNLTDHYNPSTKQLALSQNVYNSNSVAAIGVAAHEAGHAIQHARNYLPLHLRSWSVPLANFGSQFGQIAMMIGLMLVLANIAFGPVVLWAGVILFSFVVLFQVITLPVEFNATSRAKRLVVDAGIVSVQEREGMDKVLNAAALTYVAAAVTSLLTLLYFLMRSGLLGGRNN
jgi:uncharacterized protein